MDETVEAPRVMRSEKVALTEIAGCHEGEQPGFFLVREEFARKNCNLDAFERRQLEVSDEARRANDALMRKFPNSSRRYLVQRTKTGVLQILSEHLVAVDELRRLVVLGPVPVAGRFKHEEVRATRRVMVAVADVDPRLQEYQVLALTTRGSRKWGDDEVLARMGYAEVGSLTREGIGWLAAITGGADVDVYQQLSDKQLLEGRWAGARELAAPKDSRVKVSAEIATRRRFSLKFWKAR